MCYPFFLFAQSQIPASYLGVTMLETLLFVLDFRRDSPFNHDEELCGVLPSCQLCHVWIW